MALKALKVESITTELMERFIECKVFGVNGLTIVYGDTATGPRAFYMGNLPEFDGFVVKRLYAMGWKQRTIGLLFGLTQTKIHSIIRNPLYNSPSIGVKTWYNARA